MLSSSDSAIINSIVGKDNGHHNGMYTYLGVTETYIGPGGANIYWPEVRVALYDSAIVFSRWSEEGEDVICADDLPIYT